MTFISTAAIWAEAIETLPRNSDEYVNQACVSNIENVLSEIACWRVLGWIGKLQAHTYVFSDMSELTLIDPHQHRGGITVSVQRNLMQESEE